MGTWKAAPAGLVWCLAACCGVSGLSLNCAAELPDSPGATVSQSQAAPEQKPEQKNAPSQEGDGTSVAQATSPQTPQEAPQQSAGSQSSQAQSQSPSQPQTTGQKP